MSKGFFVTGTDTGVGKTCVSLGLMRALQCGGLSVAGMKPVASGCQALNDELFNDDAQRLRAQSSLDVAYSLVNPFAFEPAIAPHLAAHAGGTRIAVPPIENAFRQLAARVDAVIVEGVGGWLVPINERQSMADVAACLGLPVVLVVAIRLGCLNHALLTANAIVASGLSLAGWVANRIDADCPYQDGNVSALRERLTAPLLADLPYGDAGVLPEQLASALDVDLLCRG
jgi:dethiobiotin synthetase